MRRIQNTQKDELKTKQISPQTVIFTSQRLYHNYLDNFYLVINFCIFDKHNFEKMAMQNIIESYHTHVGFKVAPSQSATQITQLIIPIESSFTQASSQSCTTHDQCQNEQKIIPGYNFQSLFRKKSHIRLARKKNKEEAQKKNSHIKHESTEKEEKNIQKGHWTNAENKLYHWFLQLHNRHFILKYLRRTDKIFKSMATFINTREAEQCRSHHQKMEKKYHDFYQILLKLRMDFYNSADPELLKNQLEQNGYHLKENTLISEQQIKNGSIMKRQNQDQQCGEQDSLQEYIEQQQNIPKNDNMLGQNYQNELAFNNVNF